MFKGVDSLLLAVNPISLFFVAFIESIFFPIPPDTILLPLALMNPPRAIYYASICTVGSVLGAIVGYRIGVWGGQPLLKKYISQARFRRIGELFQKYEVWAIGIAGFTPIPYKVFTIGAGCFKIDFPLFVLVSLISRGLRFFLASFLVALYGAPVLDFMGEYFELLTIGIVLIIVGIYFLGKILARRRI